MVETGDLASFDLLDLSFKLDIDGSGFDLTRILFDFLGDFFSDSVNNFIDGNLDVLVLTGGSVVVVLVVVVVVVTVVVVLVVVVVMVVVVVVVVVLIDVVAVVWVTFSSSVIASV